MSDLLVLPDVPATAWEAFQAGGDPAIAAELAHCWSRARSLGAPRDGAPLDEALIRGSELALRTEHVELIGALGDAILDRATARVSERDFVLLLADRDGIVVDARGGGGFAEIASCLKLIEGANWSEAARGTNAIGTAAAANRAVAVHGHAHFGRSYHDLVCYGVPIHGIDGAPIAVLDATSRIDRAHPAVGRAILEAARSLEELVRLQAYATAGVSLTRVLGRSLDRMRDPAFLVEAPGAIARANPAARQVCGPHLGDAFSVLRLDWPMLIAEALSPSAGGRAITVRGRAWRLHAEPIATPASAIVSVLVVLEPGRLIARSTGSHPSASDHGIEPFAPIFAEDRATAAAVEWTRRLAASELPIMLLAETGAGKELFAQAIHAASSRAAGPYLAINCGALAPSLLETELFGYAAGSFTGAERTGRKGLFHAASGGTLFLDEVAEMSPAMQAALLRVVETGTFRRVGETRLERTDVRIICATCRDLEAMTASGAFRHDLYYRLKGATVRIPALRERTDVIALARHLLAGTTEVAPEAEAALARYAWPGNVRELKSVLAVARVASGNAAVIELDHLPPDVVAPVAVASPLDDAERDALVRALAESRNNVTAAARRLGVARSTVQRMMRRFGVR